METSYVSSSASCSHFVSIRRLYFPVTMYSSQSITPFSNRLLQQKFDQAQYELHRDKVRQFSKLFSKAFFLHFSFQVKLAVPSVKTRPPNIYPHLELKLKHFEVIYN